MAKRAPREVSARNEERLLRAVERLARTMAASGMPIMASRVFAYVLSHDADRFTAAELASGLRVSPAAVSGAVRYLVGLNLLVKGREPGSRAAVYRVDEHDLWSRLMRSQRQVVDQWLESLADTIAVVESQGRSSHKLVETRAYLAFLREDMDQTFERWKKARRQASR